METPSNGSRHFTDLEKARGNLLSSLIEAFLRDKKVQGLSRGSLDFYQWKLGDFITFCNAHDLKYADELTPDFLRQYFIYQQEIRTPGGVNAAFRSVKAFLFWVENEEIIPSWKAPIRKLKAPKLAQEPLQPIKMEDFDALIKTCKHGTFTGERDRAIFMVLLDTGVRAAELLAMDLADLDLVVGSILVVKGKGRKPRIVYFSRKTRIAIRNYLHTRKDELPCLWVNLNKERMGYRALRDMKARRAQQADIPNPSPHDFRRAFALEMLRNGADVFSLQRLMGHTDLTVLRRYLAQTDEDLQKAHDKGSPIENL